jgi:hypothetical protein
LHRVLSKRRSRRNGSNHTKLKTSDHEQDIVFYRYIEILGDICYKQKKDKRHVCGIVMRVGVVRVMKDGEFQCCESGGITWGR